MDRPEKLGRAPSRPSRQLRFGPRRNQQLAFFDDTHHGALGPWIAAVLATLELFGLDAGAEARQIDDAQPDERAGDRIQGGGEVGAADALAEGDLGDRAAHHRAPRGAQEGADYPAPEAIGHEHREVPDRDPHREPDEGGHYRGLPCFFRFLCLLRPPCCSRTRRRAAALASLSSGRSASGLASASNRPSPSSMDSGSGRPRPGSPSVGAPTGSARSAGPGGGATGPGGAGTTPGTGEGWGPGVGSRGAGSAASGPSSSSVSGAPSTRAITFSSGKAGTRPICSWIRSRRRR